MAKKDDYMSLAYKRAGGFDRSAYNSERKSAKSKYNTNLKSLKNEYNNFISSINSQREKNDNAFTRGRSAISEDAYFANRQSLQDLASRGLSGGLAQLNKVANDAATNRQYSDLANDYYNTAGELDTSQKNADDQYALDKESLRNDYESILANIKARENSDYMNYKQRVASLAESIQDREERAQQLKDEQDKLIYQKANEIFGTNFNKLGNKDKLEKINQVKHLLATEYGYDSIDAIAYMMNKGLLTNDIYLPLVATKYVHKPKTTTRPQTTTIPGNAQTTTIPTNRGTTGRPKVNDGFISDYWR